MRLLFYDSNRVLSNLLPNGFRDAGHEVLVTGYKNNKKLPLIVEQFQPHLILTNGWGPEQKIPYQQHIKRFAIQSGIPHVYWSVEDPAFTDSFVLPLLNRVEPNFVFSISEEAVAYFKRKGIRAAHLDWAYQPTIHYSTKSISKYQSTIAVVANSYVNILGNSNFTYRITSMKQLLQPLIQNGVRIDVWGKDWDRIKPFLGTTIPKEQLHGPLPYLLCNKVYSSTKINIGLQNYQTQITQRTYEILGSQGFLLTSDTSAIRKRFIPGEHLVVSSSPEETICKVNEYLKDPGKRDQIRRKAQQFVAAHHTYKHRAEYIIKTLTEEGIIK